MGVYVSDSNGKLKKYSGLQKTENDGLAADIAAINSVLNKTEQVEVIYDRTDSTKDWGYSGGLPNGTYQIDLSKYKKLRVYMLSEPSVGIITALMMGEIDLLTVSAENNGYRGFVDYVVPYFYIEGTSQYEVCGTQVDVPAEKNSITLTTHFFKYASSYEEASRPCYKIEGVY